MIYNILIVRNRYKGALNINTSIDWFSKYTPITIESSIIETDFDVTTQKVSNATFSGVVCSGDILPKLREIIPEGKYNAVVFVYGNSLNGIRVSSTNIDGTQPLYPDTEFIQTWNVLDNGKTINHELFHAFFYKAHKMQINIRDNMDTYILDSDLTIDGIPNTNREIALQSLAPYWDKICAFRPKETVVTITRLNDNGTETKGVIACMNPWYVSDTLERPWKNNLPNISCIPKGEYKVDYTFSWKFLKYTYEVKNVKGRSGIRFHSGNYFFDIQGCILLGNGYSDLNKDGQTDILGSRVAINAFEKILGKKSFTLIIK